MLQQDEVVEMAKLAGIEEWWDSGNEQREILQEHLEAFAKLVEERTAAKERESCIQIVENEAYQYSAPVWAFEIVNAIKDRGEQHES